MTPNSLEEVREAVENLSLLCDPEGKVCIDGTNEDRRLIQQAVDTFKSLAQRVLKGDFDKPLEVMGEDEIEYIINSNVIPMTVRSKDECYINVDKLAKAIVGHISRPVTKRDKIYGCASCKDVGCELCCPESTIPRDEPRPLSAEWLECFSLLRELYNNPASVFVDSKVKVYINKMNEPKLPKNLELKDPDDKIRLNKGR